MDKSDSDKIFDDFVDLIKKINTKSKTHHQNKLRIDNPLDLNDYEKSEEMYYFNKHIVDKVLKEHTYYRNAPIMDAGFQGLKRM